MKKICVPVFSRANYGRLKSVLKAINEHPQLTLQLVVGASALLDKYGCIKEITDDGFHPDAYVYGCVEGDKPQCMADTVGVLLPKLTQVFDILKPDMVLVHADRYEMMAVAIAASYMNIPLAHNQGGEVSGTIDDKVRNAITMLSDLHFTATEQAKWSVADKVTTIFDVINNKPVDNVINVGCPSIDLIGDLSITEDLCSKYPSVGAKIDWTQPYNVVMFHPNTQEYGEGAKQVQEIIKAIDQIGIQTVWFWPNIDAGNDHIAGELRKWREQDGETRTHFFKNTSPEDYYRIISNCRCLIGNTSSGIREGAFLGVPYVCVGTRQSNREHGSNTVFSGYDIDDIVYNYRNITNRTISHDTRFGDGTASKRIVEGICSYLA